MDSIIDKLFNESIALGVLGFIAFASLRYTLKLITSSTIHLERVIQQKDEEIAELKRQIQLEQDKLSLAKSLAYEAISNGTKAGLLLLKAYDRGTIEYEAVEDIKKANELAWKTLKEL